MSHLYNIDLQLDSDLTDNLLNNIDIECYQQMIKSLLYLALDMQSDIVQAVRILTQFITSSRTQHEQALNRVFRYLNGTRLVGISFKTGGTDLQLFGYTDANFADNVQEDRHSISDYIFFLAGEFIF